jgi:nucleoid-associated protein YgaU
MTSALESIVKAAAGTGAPTKATSRYYAAPVEMVTGADGIQVAYLQRRIIPQPEIYTATVNYVIVDGDRLDTLAARFLGDPLLFWMICDANGADDPDELTAQAGSTVQIPVASAVPPGARNA